MPKNVRSSLDAPDSTTGHKKRKRNEEEDPTYVEGDEVDPEEEEEEEEEEVGEEEEDFLQTQAFIDETASRLTKVRSPKATTLKVRADNPSPGGAGVIDMRKKLAKKDICQVFGKKSKPKEKHDAESRAGTKPRDDKAKDGEEAEKVEDADDEKMLDLSFTSQLNTHSKEYDNNLTMIGKEVVIGPCYTAGVTKEMWNGTPMYKNTICR